MTKWKHKELENGAECGNTHTDLSPRSGAFLFFSLCSLLSFLAAILLYWRQMFFIKKEEAVQPLCSLPVQHQTADTEIVSSCETWRQNQQD